MWVLDAAPIAASVIDSLLRLSARLSEDIRKPSTTHPGLLLAWGTDGKHFAGARAVPFGPRSGLVPVC